MSIESGLLPSHGHQEIGKVSSLTTKPLWDGSLVFEKDIPGLYNYQEILQMILCQRGRERVYNYKSSKENALQKGKSRVQTRKKPISTLIKLREC